MTDSTPSAAPKLTAGGKAFNISQTIVTVLVIFAMFLKFRLITGAGALLTLLLPLLSIFYIITAVRVKVSYKPPASGGIIAALGVAGLGAAITLYGILFRLQHWPGDIRMLIMGLLTLIGGVIAAFVINARKPDTVGKHVVSKFLPRFSIIIMAGAFFAFTSTEALNSWFSPWHNDPEYNRLVNECRENRTMCDSVSIYYEEHYGLRKKRNAQ